MIYMTHYLSPYFHKLWTILKIHNIIEVIFLYRARKYGWQDTYAFTKAMGEMMIDKLREDIPVVVIRPSVIESTFREPFPGWMEGNR